MSSLEFKKQIDPCNSSLYKCLNSILQRLTYIEQNCCIDVYQACPFRPLDSYSFLINEGGVGLQPDQREMWVIEYIGVQPTSTSSWIQLNTGAISSPQYASTDFTETYPGSGTATQYVNLLNTALMSVGSFYDLAASTSSIQQNGANVLIRSNTLLNNYLIVIARDTINLTTSETRRNYYSYVLQDTIVPSVGSPLGSQAWVIGATNLLQPVVPYPPITLPTVEPSNPLFWTNWQPGPIPLDGTTFDATSRYIGFSCKYLAEPQTVPNLSSVSSSSVLNLTSSVPRALPPLLTSQRTLQTSTPYDSKQTYPIQTKDDILVTSLLYQRLSQIYSDIQKLVNVSNGLELYLFGSQLKGKSRSGTPDIDISVWHPSLTQDSTLRLKWSQKIKQYISTLNFVVDILIGKQKVQVF